MNTRSISQATMAVLLIAAGVVFAGEGLSIDWYTIDGGGEMAGTGGDFELSGTIGQPDAGPTSTGGQFSLTGGFWVVAQSEPERACGKSAGDMDGDGDVDLVDFGEFQLCFTGSTGTLSTGCECADFDGDNDADLVDFGAFQLAFTGSSF